MGAGIRSVHSNAGSLVRMLAFFASLLSTCAYCSYTLQSYRRRTRNTKLLALVQSSREQSSRRGGPPTRSVDSRQRSRRLTKNTRNYLDVQNDGRWQQAEEVELRMAAALEVMKDSLRGDNVSCSRLPFPSVRECNTAMATFGDGGTFLRALSLFLKMRKATTAAQSDAYRWNVPVPTLVTYSTLMSRAVQVGKEPLALRLWYLMKTQPRFFSSSDSRPPSGAVMIVPDVKAANILMNVHAKLRDVDSAQYLLSQMIHGNGTDVPKLVPNIVTYNSLLDACHKAGDLEAALQAKQQLDESGLKKDARTYTTLIATVGRKASSVSGAKDPSMAFSFLNEMVALDIRPNGMTYSALIDACDRCGRTDMALKGLRTMLRQKSKERRALSKSEHDTYELFNEVGAWTAAINALGKAGSVETAMRLFQTMTKVGVQPNTITCGCLTDCLLRHGRTTDALSVLGYMKRHGVPPSEVMYTSLITRAGRLVEMENKQKWNGFIDYDQNLSRGDDTTAIEIYTALMKTLLGDSRVCDSENGSAQLIKVFLVFQEMKAAGAEPDLACYNALLRACARAGDMTRVAQVFRKIKEDGLIPNDTSWREGLKAAANSHSSVLAEEIWTKGLEFSSPFKIHTVWNPSVDSFSALLSAYLREAKDLKDRANDQAVFYMKVLTMYKDIMTGSSKRKISKEELISSPRALGMILRAAISLDFIVDDNKHKMIWRRIAISIASLDVWNNENEGNDTVTRNSLQIANKWKRDIEENTIRSV